MPQKSSQSNSQKENKRDSNNFNFGPENANDNLPPETKAKIKSAKRVAANDNLIYGKFTNQKNREKEGAESQEFFQNNAEANLPQNLQSVYDPQKRFIENNKKEVSANDNIELAKYRAQQNKNKYYKNNNKQNSINDIINRANGIRSAVDTNKSNENKRQVALRVSAIQKVFREEKINLTENEAMDLLDSGFKVPFPSFMFMFAVCKDVSDIFLNVISAGLLAGGTAATASILGSPVGMPMTGLGIAIGMINSIVLTPLYLIIFNIWLRKYGQDKNNFKSAPKLTSKIVKKLMPALVAKMIIELIPFINALPINTVNVVSVYKFYTKLARKSKAATS